MFSVRGIENTAITKSFKRKGEMGMVKKINEFRELQKKKGKKGFSMIELIIVIAIMAILVALIGTQLIPYLEKSREKRDMTTLDTCKTAFESVVADKELSMSDGDYSISDLDSNGSTDGADAFYEYSGLSASATPFKSNDAGTSNGPSDITFTYASGVLTTVTVGSLSITAN